VHSSILRLPPTPILTTSVGAIASASASALLLTLVSTASVAAIPKALSVSECLVQLDAAVTLAQAPADEPDLDEATDKLQTLAAQCQDLPQIQHNLGVIAARDNRLPEAISYLEASVAADPRAAQSVAHLQEIFRYRASIAYANALNMEVQASSPKYVLQDSTDQNSDSLRLQRERSELHTVGTIEYELYAWWQTRHDERQDIQEFYVNNYPAVSIELALERYVDIDWDNIKREIAFTQEDAVVVLSEDSQEVAQEKTLLLMRLEGNRWKIYQETAL